MIMSKVNLTIGSLNVFMEDDESFIMKIIRYICGTQYKHMAILNNRSMNSMKELHKIMEGDRDALKEMMTETDDEDEVEEYVDDHRDLGRKAITGTGDIVYG